MHDGGSAVGALTGRNMILLLKASYLPRLGPQKCLSVPATSLQHSMNKPSAFFMMFALCSAVTFWRLLSLAYLKAYSATRVLATRVITCKHHAR